MHGLLVCGRLSPWSVRFLRLRSALGFSVLLGAAAGAAGAGDATGGASANALSDGGSRSMGSFSAGSRPTRARWLSRQVHAIRHAAALCPTLGQSVRSWRRPAKTAASTCAGGRAYGLTCSCRSMNGWYSDLWSFRLLQYCNAVRREPQIHGHRVCICVTRLPSPVPTLPLGQGPAALAVWQFRLCGRRRRRRVPVSAAAARAAAGAASRAACDLGRRAARLKFIDLFRTLVHVVEHLRKHALVRVHVLLDGP